MRLSNLIQFNSVKMFHLRLFLLIMFLFFSLQSWTKASDITEFEIEGISVGDSALEHFNINDLINDKTYYYKNEKYAGVIFFDNLEIYDDLQITFDPNDKDLKIVSVEGALIYRENIDECYTKQKK